MIRRDCTLDDGRPGWLLIRQTEHARLAAELARNWSFETGEKAATSNRRVGGVSPPNPAQKLAPEFFTAILRHDDGWIEWENAPAVVPDDGRPRSFTEMRLEETLAIWSKSIERALPLGPLAAWLVAGHFASLLAGGSEADQEPALKWLSDIAARRAAWFAEWQTALRENCSPRVGDWLLSQLQYFDGLSLWLCLRAPAVGEMASDPTTPPPAPPGGGPFRAAATASDVRIVPWPFDVPAMQLSATCMRVPVRPFTDAGDLLAAQEPHRLQWKLIRC